MIPDLKTALGLGDAPRVAFVGAGGKTTALFRLAREYRSPVLAAATAHLELWQTDLADAHFCCSDSQDGALPVLPSIQGVTLFTGERNNRSVAGLGPTGLQQVATLACERQMPLLLESDGSRRHPIKAPADHEPPIPSFVDTVVVTAGFTALGNSISTDWVHRPEIFASLSEGAPGSVITPEIVRRVLCHPNGGLKNIPEAARRVALLNQADTPELWARACSIAPALLQEFQAVVITALKKASPAGDWVEARDVRPGICSVYEPVAGIILAGEDSTSTKSSQLLAPWKNEPLVRQVARSAIEAGLSPVIVVTDVSADRIRPALKGMPVQVVTRPVWDTGQGWSVRAGLQTLPGDIKAVVLLLGDQPPTQNILVRSLVHDHARTKAPAIAGERGNPVLFDRIVFPELLNARCDVGYQQVFSRYPPCYARDGDVPAMYQE